MFMYAFCSVAHCSARSLNLFSDLYFHLAQIVVDIKMTFFTGKVAINWTRLLQNHRE